MKRFVSILSLWLALVPLVAADKPDPHAKAIASLIDPEKLASLKERGANPRIQKYVAQLALVKQEGGDPAKVTAEAVKLVGMKGDAAKLTTEAMLRNLHIADSLGCLDAAGIADMRQGEAATVKSGPYKDDQLSVDHIIPRKVAPELDNTIANLELLPFKLNAKKSASIGDRQRSLAKKLRKAGLLSEQGLKDVLARR